MEMTPIDTVFTQQTPLASTEDFESTNEQNTTTLTVTEGLDEKSSTVEFYCKIVLILIGFVGTVANGIALFALVFDKQVIEISNTIVGKKHKNIT
jgi:hypothetical protein